MYFTNDKINIYYEKYGKGHTIVILHGWGRSIEDFVNISKILSEKYQVYLIDLPGFGKSNEPLKPYSLDDYVNCLIEFFKKEVIKDPIIIAHSFGGRIAIRYAIEHKVKKMILIASAGIKRFSWKNKIKIINYKVKKWYYKKFNKIALYEKLITTSGSDDYRLSSNIMKKTLSNVVNTNQRKEIKKISCEVLLIWGKNDCATPYKDALLMKRQIKNSGLVTFNTGHFAFIEEEFAFKKVISSYLQIGDKQ